MHIFFLISLILTLVFSSNLFADECRTALTISSTNAGNSGSFYKKQVANAKAAGFIQVDQSDYFRRGGILVHINKDGTFKLFTSVSQYFADSDNHQFLSMKLHTKPDYEDRLDLYFKEKHGIFKNSIYPSGYGSGPVEEKDLVGLHRLSHRKQLVKCGFIQDTAVPSIYRLEVKSYYQGGRSKTVIAVLNTSDHLVQLVSPADNFFNDLLKPDTEIIGFRLFSNQLHAGLSAIRLRQNFIEFDLTDEFDGGTMSKEGQRKILAGREARPSRGYDGTFYAYDDSSKLSYEERRTLYQGIKLQADQSPVSVTIETEEGKPVVLTYNTLEEVGVDSTSNTIRLILKGRMGSPQYGSSHDLILGGIPSIESYFGTTALVLKPNPQDEDSFEVNGIYGLKKKNVKRVIIAFKRRIEPISFDLMGLTKDSHPIEIGKFARFILANYGYLDSRYQNVVPQKQATLNFYGDNTTTSWPVYISVVESVGDTLTIKAYTDKNGENSIVMRGKLNQLIPHERHTEVILDVIEFLYGNSINIGIHAPLFTDRNLKVNFKLDVGHGVFGR